MISNKKERAMSKLIFFSKNLIYVLFAFVASVTSRKNVLILCYHSIDSKEDFFKQMEYLRKKYRLVSLNEIPDLISNAKSLHRSSVAITFDDGYLDNFTIAYPYFKKYDIPATIFVATGYVGKKMQLDKKYLPMLDWKKIKVMSKGQVSIGAHTITHPKLTNLSDDTVVSEIDGSRLEIKNQIGQEPSFFAFPCNAYNQRLIDIVKGLGFKGAVLGAGAMQGAKDHFVLNRVAVDGSINFMVFKARLTKATNYYVKLEAVIKKMFGNLPSMREIAKVYNNSDAFRRIEKDRTQV